MEINEQVPTNTVPYMDGGFLGQSVSFGRPYSTLRIQNQGSM
mgnify:CR=1 FL=1